MKPAMLKRPLVALLLPVLITTFVTILIWLVFYNPAIIANDKQIHQVRQELAVIDRRLAQRKEHTKSLDRYIALTQVSTQLNKQNASIRDLLANIIAVEKTGNSLVSIHSPNQHSLRVMIQTSNLKTLYSLSEAIEYMPIIDRITLLKNPDNNKQVILTVYTKKSSGDSL